MGLHAILLVFVVCNNLLFHDKVQCSLDLFNDKKINTERQLKLLNKPAVKTFVNKYGDIYDCVDFYKQPAFDHPLLKNHTFDFQIKGYNKKREQDPLSASKYNFKGLEVQKCPIGSIPIRRLTKASLIKGTQALEDTRINPTNRPGIYLAIARTRGDQVIYFGGESKISLHNPKASGSQFTAARIKLQNGPDSIEAGWRVDPTLYGDNKTRFFVRTDAGTLHCFDTLCPGFVHTNPEFALAHVFTKLSIQGGPTSDFHYRIERDNRTRNWNLMIGAKNSLIGFWPSRIFTKLNRWATYIEWGGVAYSPPGSPLPQMGTGNFPIGNVFYDGYFRNMKVIYERGQIEDAKYTDVYTDDSSLYSVIKYHKRYKRALGCAIFYGGPGHRK